MEEQKNSNSEVELEAAEEQNSQKTNSSTRSSILWIFAGGYLVYTGYRLCQSVLTGTDNPSKGFLVAGGIFVVIGAVLLIMAIRNLAKEGAQKAAVQEAEVKKTVEESAKKKMSISERAHLAENLDDEEDMAEKVDDSSAE